MPKILTSATYDCNYKYLCIYRRHIFHFCIHYNLRHTSMILKIKMVFNLQSSKWIHISQHVSINSTNLYRILPSKTFVRSSTSIHNPMYLSSSLGVHAVCIFANYNDIRKSSCLDQNNVDRYSSQYSLGIHSFQHILQSWRSD